ncbi:hypothetical protein GLAREA_06244 [Glarea lozoyensis ATCC 20868]|uniref:Uncharacterized protein n=1 Tax=Glarea lozoyensis (strain ATCC 20868 / MF5171) TaxID=1116229 RepID=S3D444_GLAL2|nr:uncharacterized protein GLAREA_06244 [Glarea lozoyensis ATCC 20868]EPE33232.1 hypothetical protein GLAREA_06244 [Glarea lozoyensis ATCC 20868]
MAPQPAYVVDYDDEKKKAVKGTKQSARSSKKLPKISQREPEKDSSKRRKQLEFAPERRPEKNVEIITEREIKHDRRSSFSSTSPKSPRKSARPPSAHKNQNFPRVKEEQPRHFGIQPAQPTPSAPPLVSHMTQPTMSQPIARPRAQTAFTSPYPSRPTSYHAAYSGSYGAGPPLSGSAWANYVPQPQAPTYNPPTIIAPSHSPSPYAQGQNYQYSTPVYHAPSVPGSDYFGSQASSAPERPMSARPLSSRFDTPARTASGYGMRDTTAHEQSMSYDSLYHDDGYASQAEGVIARPRNSIRQPSRRSQQAYESDYDRMPPPPRPSDRPERRSSLRHSMEHSPAESYPDDRGERRTLIRDDPPRTRRTSKHRNSVTYDLPDAPQEREPSRTRRPASHRNSASYDIADSMSRVTLEPQSNQGRRRSSYYGPSAATSGHTSSSAASGLEAKMNAATHYQDDVGGPTPQLTAEALKKQQRRHHGGSSRSSASRDESDYRKSATTRTTRSGSGNDDENVTIKVTGRAHVNVGGAQIDCPDGGEIEIKRQQRGNRGGSDRSISEYGPYPGQAQIDDRRSRVDQPAGRSRISSQHSYTRATKYVGEGYF